MDIRWHSNKWEQRCKALDDCVCGHIRTWENKWEPVILVNNHKEVTYLFPLFVGTGPLKSMLILSNGWVALIRGTFSWQWYWGLHSQQTGHWLVIFWTSSREQGEFLVRTKWFSLVMPGWQSASWSLKRESSVAMAHVALDSVSAGTLSLPGRWTISKLKQESSSLQHKNFSFVIFPMCCLSNM